MKWLKGFACFLCVLFGIFTGGWLVYRSWSPLLVDTPHDDMSFSHIAEADKRAFFRTLYETYESENPRSEWEDAVAGVRLSYEELRPHYEQFDRLLIRMRAKGCPTKEVIVPTRWDDGVDRKFQIFDVEQCQ